jgi:hypothetical protein
MKQIMGKLWRRFKPVKLVIDYKQGEGWYVGIVEGYTTKISPYFSKPELAIQLKAMLSQIQE